MIHLKSILNKKSLDWSGSSKYGGFFEISEGRSSFSNE